jgi:hypothetical protein
MDILTVNNRKKYKKIPEILKKFGKTVEAYMKAIYIPKGRKDILIVFINGSKKNRKGGLTSVRNRNWLNFPVKENDWKCFIQVQRAGDPEILAAKRVIDQVDKKKQAIFILEEDGYYYFHGVYKSTLKSVIPGVCVFHRIGKSLKIADWQNISTSAKTKASSLMNKRKNTGKGNKLP